MQEVGPLNELVGELGERHALALAVEALLDRVFGHHVIDRNALADIADELQKRELLHPVVVVDQLGRVRFVGREVDQPLELPADTLLIAAQRLLVEQVALERLAGRVANHARRSADQKDRLMAATLEMLQDHHADQMPDMQRVGRRINPDVGGRHFLGQLFLGARHDVVNHASPPEFLNKIHRLAIFV